MTLPNTPPAGVVPMPLRLRPGEDLRDALVAHLKQASCSAAFVVAGMGSLARISLRRAGAAHADIIDGTYELLTLSGSLHPEGAHLHAVVADAAGVVSGGHVTAGCIVRTTAEVLVVALPGFTLGRALDETTGYRELTIAASAPAPRDPQA
jgi:uncharacterized protein